jgi:hypothetical protein
LIVIHAEHDNPRVGIILADTTHQLEAGKIGQIDIDDRHVGPLRQIRAVARFLIDRLIDGYRRVGRKQRTAARHHDGVVIDNQELHRLGHRRDNLAIML